MGVISRGLKGTFRSKLRTSAFVTMLAISMGLSFSMLLAHQAVKEGLTALRAQIGTTAIVTAAGVRDASGGGAALLGISDVHKLRGLAHVKAVDASLTFLIQKSDTPTPTTDGAWQDSSSAMLTTSLLSAAELPAAPPGVTVPKDLPTPPIGVDGLSGSRNTDGKLLVLTSGHYLDTDDATGALIGKNLAEKNKLHTGDTFAIKDTTFKVKGIFDAGTSFRNNSVKLSLKAAQTLTKQPGQIETIVLTADSVDSLETVQTTAKKSLGASRVDVLTTEPNASEIVSSLNTVATISLTALLISLLASSFVVFLTMVIVVREQFKEIGTLKALGGSSLKIVAQFVVEAVALTSLAAIIGAAGAVMSGNRILHSLVVSQIHSGPTNFLTSNTHSTSNGPRPASDVHQVMNNLRVLVDYHLVIYGLCAAIGIAIAGCVIPALLIARMRPAEVMRGNE